jgi:hypothetical protein
LGSWTDQEKEMMGITFPDNLLKDPISANFLGNKRPVALAGRVPVKVTNENGPIKIGDYLTSASRPGYAMKAIGPGIVIGRSMDNFNGNEETGKIIAFINVGYYDGGANFVERDENSTELSVENDESNIGIIVAKNGIDMASSTIFNVAAINGLGNKWAIDDNGNFMITGEIVKKVETSSGTKDLYPAYNGDPTIMLTGSGELMNGEARIVFDSTLTEIIDVAEQIKVSVSLTSDSASGIYVAQKSVGDILVKEVNGGKGGATFDYIIVARRKFNGTYAAPMAYQIITSTTTESGNFGTSTDIYGGSLLGQNTTSTTGDGDSLAVDQGSSASTPAVAEPIVMETSTSTEPIATETPTSTEPVATETPTSTPVATETATSTEPIATETVTSTPIASEDETPAV